jgi:tRNA(Ile)-lysidine synthase TilS/MesJ
LPDNTSKIDLLDKLRQKLLITVARRLNCNIIFQANSAMNIATKVLGDICLGRSTELSMLANFCNAQYTDIKILKPMKDFTQQELLYYSECYKIDSIKSKESNVSSSMKSIQSLAHNFITKLESQFPGTVSAVSRTAEKLSVKGNEEQNVGNDCILCNAKLDFISHDNEISAMRAIEVSKLISSEYVVTKSLSSNKKNEESICKNLLLNNEKCCSDNANCIKNNGKSKQKTSEDIQKCLCYSCRLIFRNLDIHSIFPTSSLCIIEQKLALKKMRKEINDFLL